MVNWQFIAIYTFIVFTVVTSIPVEKCDDSIPGAVNFESEGCINFPCPLVRNTTSNTNITFRIPADTDYSTVKIEAKTFFPGWINFPLPDSDTCHNLLNSYCPLDENEVVTYHLAIPVAKAYPKLQLTLRIQFLDEKQKPMMCIMVPCAVVDPK